jgi:hypothetical protein
MPDSENTTGEPALTRGFWRGLLGAGAVLAAYCLLNILVDPTGEFGQSGRYAFNRAPPPAVIASGEAGGDPAFYRRAIRESEAGIFLIGASRTWRGFDTCSRPAMLRIAGSAWGVTELARLERAILEGKERPVTLLVEVGLPQDERARAISPLRTAASVALSPRTAWFSLQTIAASLGGHPQLPAYTSCTPRPSPPADWREAARNVAAISTLIDATPESLQRGRDNLMAMADDADRLCARTGVRHSLIFFTLPVTPDGSPARAYDLIVRRDAERIAALFASRAARPGGCAIRYANFATIPPGSPAERLLWRDRAFWSDYSHFSPPLGEIALTALLGGGSPALPPGS